MKHVVIGVLLLTCVVWFDRAMGLSSMAQSNDADPIRLLVGRLFESYQQKDLDKLISLWSEESTYLAENKKNLQGEFFAYDKLKVKSFDIRQTKIDGDKATLRVVAEMALTRAKMLKPTETLAKKNWTIELVGEGGIWKIWKFIASEEKLAAEIIAANTEEDRKVLMEKEPELLTSDLATILARQNTSNIAYQKGYQHALAINQLASKLAEKIGDQLVMGKVLYNTGYIYGWLGGPEKSPEIALGYYRKSLKIGEEFGFKDLALRSQMSSAIVYHSIGDHSHAIEYYQQSLKSSEELGDVIITTQVLNNLGSIYRLQSKLAQALEVMLISLKLSENRPASGTYWADISRIMANIGATFRAQGNVEQALAYFQKAYETSQKGGKLESPDAKLGVAQIVAELGSSHFQQGNYPLANEYYQKSQKLMEEVGDRLLNRKDSFISWIKSNMGDILVAEKKPLDAMASYQESLMLAEKSRDKTRMAYPLSSLGKIHLLQGDYRGALTLAERAVKAAEQVSQPDYLTDALVIVSQAYQKLGHSEDARQALAKAIDVTEQLRDQSVGNELDRQRAFEYTLTPYQAMIDFQADQKQFTEAFSYAQRAKGRTLLELLQNGRVDIDKSASPTEREQEQQHNQKIVSLNRQVTAEKLKPQPDEKRLAEFEEQLKKARLEFEAFQTTLYASHPELKVQRGEIRPFSFDDAADLIPDSKTALLDFIVTDENVHLFVLTKDDSAKPTLNTYTVKIDRKSLAEEVERYRRRMENRDYDFQAISKYLYVLLLKPAQKQLQNKSSLIISPDNVLWDLPFQALLSPELRYLIEDAAISYTPSLSVLREMRLAGKKNQTPAKPSLLALGNPALGNRSKDLVKFVKMDTELQPLPEAAAQVRALGRLYGPRFSRVFTGPAAREEVVKRQSADYRILHLATHGILNDVSPMYSHVMLSQTPGKSDEDGLLEAWEMMNLDLDADLVVLTACDTARGRVGAGEGMIGMSWALFVAGCPRTVVSQWKVEASSTADLMVEFHKKFKTKYGRTQSMVSTAEAMRQAALKVMNNPEYVHPFYWGGFVVVGDGN